MTQPLRELATPSGTHVWFSASILHSLQAPVTPGPEDLTSAFDFCGHLGIDLCILIQTHFTNIIKLFKILKINLPRNNKEINGLTKLL